MGIVSFFRKLFGKKAQEEAVESLTQSQITQSLTQIPKEAVAVTTYPETHELSPPPKMELERDSLQLGIAAGYTGRSIRDIEASLSRIEVQMTTKDWFLANFEDRTPELIELLKQHDENEEKRLNNIQKALNSLRGIAEAAPEPLKTQILAQVQAVEEAHLRPKMQMLIQTVKEAREISYTDLAQKLNISEDALRGLVSQIVKKTNKIERFKRNKKGWVRYIGD